MEAFCYVGVCKKCAHVVVDGDLKINPDNTVQVINADVNNFKDKLQYHLEHSHHVSETSSSDLTLNDYRFIPKQPLTDYAIFYIRRLVNKEMVSFMFSVRYKGAEFWTARNTDWAKVFPV